MFLNKQLKTNISKRQLKWQTLVPFKRWGEERSQRDSQHKRDGPRLRQTHTGSMRRNAGSPSSRDQPLLTASEETLTAPLPHSLEKFFRLASPKPVYPASPIPFCRNDRKEIKACAHIFLPLPCLLMDLGLPRVVPPSWGACLLILGFLPDLTCLSV